MTATGLPARGAWGVVGRIKYAIAKCSRAGLRWSIAKLVYATCGMCILHATQQQQQQQQQKIDILTCGGASRFATDKLQMVTSCDRFAFCFALLCFFSVLCKVSFKYKCYLPLTATPSLPVSLSFSVSYVPRFVAATIFNGLTADSECTLEIVGASALDPKSHAHTRAEETDATHSAPSLPLPFFPLTLSLSLSCSCSSSLANSVWLLP